MDLALMFNCGVPLAQVEIGHSRAKVWAILLSGFTPKFWVGVLIFTPI
jgi:hypothetical protein